MHLSYTKQHDYAFSSHVVFLFTFMKKLYLFISLLVLSGFFFLCCDKETDPIILVTSDNFISPLQANIQVRFKIEAKSKKSTITRIEIKEYSSDYGYKTLKDTIIDETSTSFFFEYLTSLFSKNQEIQLVFTVYNDKKEKNTVSLRYDYIFEDELLNEYSGYSMYTLMSGKPNGFSLDSKQIVYTNTGNYSYVDFYSYQDADTLIDPNLLQRTWKSYTNLNFVKFNGFDYSKATRKSLTASYLAGVRLPTMIEIETDDVILIGFGETPKGVIKVIGVFDEEGYLNDRYVFSIKLIE